MRPVSVPAPAKSRLAQATSQYAAAAGLYQIGRQAWSWHQSRRTFSVEVLESDTLFHPLVAWVETHASDAKPVKHLEAITTDRHREGEFEPETPYSMEYSERRLNLKYIPSSSTAQEVVFDGHKIEATVVSPELGGAASSMVMDRKALLRRLVFSAKSKEGHDAIRALISKVRDSQKSEQKASVVHIRESYGGWGKRPDIQLRDLDTVILPAGQMERITADLENFLASEEDHTRRGIPYHRGYCFFGPPGTGKTSIAKGLAKEYGLDLYYLPLSTAKNDMDLISILSDIRPRSILLLEDVDIFTTVERVDNPNGASLSAFLNSLDGVTTPGGLISILTSNDLSAIDPAILRPGRIDLMEEIGPLTGEAADRLYKMWYGQDPIVPIRPEGRTSADLCGILKANFNTPMKAEAEIHSGAVYGHV